jgi:hypothetical protein
MTVKERLAQLIKMMPEEQAERVLEFTENLTEEDAPQCAGYSKQRVDEIVRDVRAMKKFRPNETPEETFARIGPWEDDRTMEEIVEDIYSSRTRSEPEVELL